MLIRVIQSTSELLAYKETALKICLNDMVPGLQAHVSYRLSLCIDARIVDQDGSRAELAVHLLENAANKRESEGLMIEDAIKPIYSEFTQMRPSPV